MAPPNTRTQTKDTRNEDVDSSHSKDFQLFVRTALLEIKDNQLPNMQGKLVSLEKSLVFEAKQLLRLLKKRMKLKRMFMKWSVYSQSMIRYSRKCRRQIISFNVFLDGIIYVLLD